MMDYLLILLTLTALLLRIPSHSGRALIPVRARNFRR
jgi:hypothetical protein